MTISDREGGHRKVGITEESEKINLRDVKIAALEERVRDLIGENEELEIRLVAAVFLVGYLRRREIEAQEAGNDKLAAGLVETCLNRAEFAEKDAGQDEITEALNLKGFFKAVRERIHEGKSGVFILIDANRFKPINDNFGHETGNRALKALATKLRNQFESMSGIVGRVGGDEFAVFVEASIEEIKDKLPRNEQGDSQIVAKYTISDDNQQEKIFTASVGMVDLGPNDSLEAVANNADRKMYESKLRGKSKNPESRTMDL